MGDLSADRSAIFAFFALNAIALPAAWLDSQAFPATSITTAIAGRGLLVAGGACVLFVVCKHPRKNFLLFTFCYVHVLLLFCCYC